MTFLDSRAVLTISISAAVALSSAPAFAKADAEDLAETAAVAISPAAIAQLETLELPGLEEYTDPDFVENELPTQPDYQTGPTEPGNAPDFLNADPNPLRYPTRPVEVEIIGTQPITLEQAVELAYENSQTLQISLLQLEQRRAALREAQAALYPTVDASATLSGQNSDPTNTFDTSVSGTIRADYDLFTSGRRDANIRAVERQLRFDELTVEQTREDLRLNTTNDYYTLQEFNEQVRINQAFLAQTERNLEDTRIREEVGVGTRFDVLRAEVEVANARQTLVESESERRIAQRRLANRLNLPPTVDISAVPPTLGDPWPLSLEDSIILAYQNRAELEQQLVQREVGEQQRRAALAALGPQVGLSTFLTLQDTLNRGGGVNDTFSVSANASWRLFDGGAAAAAAAQLDRTIDIAEETFSQTRGNIRFAVEEAYSNLQANRANVRTNQLAVEQAREAVELANLRFNAGVDNQLSVIEAQANLAEAEGNLVTAVVGYNRALASMERAISNLPDGLTVERPLSEQPPF